MYELSTREARKNKDISERRIIVFKRENDGCEFNDTE